MSPDLALLAFTLEMAAISTALLLPVGVALAWGLAHRGGAAKGLIEAVCSLPLVLPPTAVGFLLLRLLAPAGPFGGWLDRHGIEVLFTPAAVVIASMTMSLPLLVRSARAAFEEVDPRLVAMARSLGRSRTHAFARVVLPLAWRGVLTGAVLAFARAVGEFGATVLVAGNIPGRTQTIALAIFQRVEVGEIAGADRLVAITVALALVAMVSTEWLATRRAARLRT
jgi:molybdate transport system permease protein